MKKISLLFFAIALLAGCTNDDFTGEKQQVQLKAGDVVLTTAEKPAIVEVDLDGGLRTQVNDLGGNILSWKSTDQIGLYTATGSHNFPFSLVPGDNTMSGGKFILSDNSDPTKPFLGGEYIIYSPYVSNHNPTPSYTNGGVVEFDMSTQDAGEGADNVGDLDVLYVDGRATYNHLEAAFIYTQHPGNGSVSAAEFKRAVSFLRLKVSDLPEGDYNQLEMAVSNPVFTKYIGLHWGTTTTDVVYLSWLDKVTVNLDEFKVDGAFGDKYIWVVIAPPPPSSNPDPTATLSFTLRGPKGYTQAIFGDDPEDDTTWTTERIVPKNGGGFQAGKLYTMTLGTGGTEFVKWSDFALDKWDGGTNCPPVVDAEGYYLIYKACELAWVAKEFNTYSVLEPKIKLKNDIDLNGIAWVGFVPPFTGIFDGGDHKITGLTYSTLVGNIAAGASVKDVTIVDPVISWSTYDNIGVIAMTNKGTIEGCIVEGSGTVAGQASVGGIVGVNEVGGSITNCEVSYSIDAAGADVGGIVGINRGVIDNCHFTGGTIESANNKAGGIVGQNEKTVKNCTVSGSTTITASNNAGGIAGRNFNGDKPIVENCEVSGSVTIRATTGAAGGIVGTNNLGEIYACLYKGTTVTGTTVGGIVGSNTGTVAVCYYNGENTNLTATTRGGIAGANAVGGKIFSCVSRYLMSATGGAGIGSIAGINNVNNDIDYCVGAATAVGTGGRGTNYYAVGNVSSSSIVINTVYPILNNAATDIYRGGWNWKHSLDFPLPTPVISGSYNYSYGK
jgi:hypothetical protein